MTDAVFFELGGTLADTSADVINTINSMRKARGYPPFTDEQIRRWLGSDLRALINATVPIPLPPGNYDKAVDEFMDKYLEMANKNTIGFDGIAAAVNEIQAAGIKVLVICRHSEQQAQAITKRIRINPDQILIDPHDWSAGRSGAMLNKAIKANSYDCPVYIGNSEIGFLSAIHGNVKAYVAGWGHVTDRFRDYLADPDQVLVSPSDLINEVLGK